MSTTPSPKPGSYSTRGDSRQRLITIAAGVIILLLGLNAYLLINTMKQGRENRELNTQLDQSEELKADLEKQYYEALSDLEEQRGRNEELNTLIDQQKEELRQQKDRIEGMLGDTRRLREAREEIRRMAATADQYLAQINQLKSENQELTAENVQLTESKQALESTLTTERQKTTQLETEQEALRTRNEALREKTESLNRQVTKASVIQVGSVEVTGQRLRNNGKPARKKAAKSVEQLQVCFQTSLNELVSPGIETFYIRIVGPSGSTLAIDELGSGQLVKASDGQAIRYTTLKDVDYDQVSETWCTIWAPGQAFDPGIYQVEVFNKGYLAGAGTFTLK